MVEVPVDRPVPVPVDRPVPYPVEKRVEVKVPYPVDRPVVHERTITVEKRVPYPVPYTVEKTVYIDTPAHEPIFNGTIQSDVYYEPGAAVTEIASPLFPVADGPLIVEEGTVWGQSTVGSRSMVFGEPTVRSRSVERTNVWIEPAFPIAVPPPIFATPPMRRPISSTQTTKTTTRTKRGKLSRLLHRHNKA
jgi:hypothetical protein